MKLIADSGSTKTDWALIGDDGSVVATCKTQGINPIHLSDDEVLHVFREELCLPTPPSEVFFYGSGVTEAMKPKMTTLLSQVFSDAKVEAESDLLGAARALFGHEKGIACILGTGANSCLFDGEKIQRNTPPLGYILGDEGSGAVLGKQFLNGIFKGGLPATLKTKYLKWSGLDYPAIINKVYREPLANRYLASIAPFISQQIAEGEKYEAGSDELEEAMALYRMVLGSFNQFYENNILPYLDYLKEEPTAYVENKPSIAFVGSIAYYFSKPLANVFTDEHGFKIAQILKAPMEGLIKYHSMITS